MGIFLLLKFSFTLIFTAYLILIAVLISAVLGYPKFSFSKKKKEQTAFTLIIPFRNEEKNLRQLLRSLSELKYPRELFEVIFVNDASEDRSVERIDSFTRTYPDIKLRIIDNKRTSASPKKDAITKAISESQHEWIMTTDADCKLPRNWLKAYDAFIIEKQPVFIAAPVSYIEKKGFLHEFQAFDWLSLTGVTIGAFGVAHPVLCSGANMGYKKCVFLEVEGYSMNNNIASGDDVFLLHSIHDLYPSDTHFLNSTEALVQTSSVSTWKELIQQRIRWAGKTSKIHNDYLKRTGLLVFSMNVILLITLLFSLLGFGWFKLLRVFFVSKLIFDTALVYATAQVLKQRFNFVSWLLSSLAYPFFSVYIVVKSLVLNNYEWKERMFEK